MVAKDLALLFPKDLSKSISERIISSMASSTHFIKVIKETEEKIMGNAAFGYMLKSGGNVMIKTAFLPQDSNQIDYTQHLLCVVGLGQDKKWESFLLVCQEQVINFRDNLLAKENLMS
ncbi:hypothetical protein DUI87_23881 [Hirundo rustica rustica]|uniref:Uncharacterized protein n=1 Tax=Hirundo rustica rustica TaxID=333673 RepID=A0A3M0JFL3_HIRRU|nr:hypothetical protein DUI87_23881 [Hirundo rustica rustica]